MPKKRGLGRGLDMLIPSIADTSDKKETSEITTSVQIEENDEKNKNSDKNTDVKNKQKNKNKEESTIEDVVEVNIQKIEPNRTQPRTVFDEDAIEELSDSIKKYGVIQPLIVQKKENYYEIIAGERRWRAAKKAGLKKLPVIVRTLDEKETLKISLIENIQREDLNAIEEAKAYEQLKKEYGLKQDEIAASVSKSRTAITNTMRLLKLDDRVQKMILENLISSGHGRTLLSLEEKEKQYEVALKILDNNISVRDTEKLVKKIIEEKEETSMEEIPENKNEKKDEMYSFYENKMKEIIGSKVTIKNKKNNKGHIEIEYYSQEELERIIDLIQSIK